MKNWQKPLWISVLAISVVGLTGGLFLHQASAATGQIYITPAANSVQSGNNITLAVRINPAINVNAVQATITFDATKLKFVGDDPSASPFGTQIQRTQSGGTLTIARGDLTGGGTTADSIIDSISFTALAGSGSTAVTLSNANATDSTSGNFTNPSIVNAVVNFTTASCPTGQTGTPPNCVTPVAPPATSTTTTPVSSGSTKTTPTTGTSTGATGSTSAGTATTPPKITANTIHSAYSVASVSVSSNVPTKAYIKYGLAKDALLISTPSSDLATTHTVTLDPAVLIPGETYYYTVVTTDAAGNTAQSTVASFTLKGLQLKVGVFDKNQKPLRGATVTLHSTPKTVKTDKNGYALLTDVTPGVHHLTYVSGGKTYSQEIQAANNITTSGDSQTAPVQNFSVVYSFAQSSSMALRYSLASAALVICAVAITMFIRRQRQLIAQPVLVSDAKVISTSTGPLASISSDTRQDTNEAAIERSEQLAHISGEPVLTPGSTVTPGTNTTNEEEK